MAPTATKSARPPTAPAVPAERAPVSAVGGIDMCGVLVIDASGGIVAANRSATELLGAAGRALVGSLVSEILIPDAAASTGEWDWKALSRAAMERWSTLTVQFPGAQPRGVRVRLERAFGGAGTYVAVLQPALRPA